MLIIIIKVKIILMHITTKIEVNLQILQIILPNHVYTKTINTKNIIYLEEKLPIKIIIIAVNFKIILLIIMVLAGNHGIYNLRI